MAFGSGGNRGRRAFYGDYIGERGSEAVAGGAGDGVSSVERDGTGFFFAGDSHRTDRFRGTMEKGAPGDVSSSRKTNSGQTYSGKAYSGKPWPLQSSATSGRRSRP